VSIANETAIAMPADALGRPLRDLRVSLIETCNYRCPYCMPEGTTPEETALDRSRRLSFDEIETAVRGFVRLGVRKVRLTGGEPLLRKNLPELVARLVAIRGVEDLALTTNGSLLAAQACTGSRSAWTRWMPGYSAGCRAIAAKWRTCWQASPRRRMRASPRSSSTPSCSVG
jgi:sulfatase maturation enzyme AslB (radical SAM superfamily)